MYPVYDLSTEGGLQALAQPLDGKSQGRGTILPYFTNLGGGNFPQALSEYLNTAVSQASAGSIAVSEIQDQTVLDAFWDFFKTQLVYFDGGTGKSFLLTMDDYGEGYNGAPSFNFQKDSGGNLVKLDLIVGNFEHNRKGIFSSVASGLSADSYMQIDVLADSGSYKLGPARMYVSPNNQVQFDDLLPDKCVCLSGAKIGISESGNAYPGYHELSEFGISPFGVIVSWGYYVVLDHIGDKYGSGMATNSVFIFDKDDVLSYVDFVVNDSSFCPNIGELEDGESDYGTIESAKEAFPDYDWDNPITEPYPEDEPKGLSATKKHFIRIS